MSYVYESENGQQLVVENDGDYTQVSLSSGSGGQQQSQATGFETGKWSKPPALYRLNRDWVLRLETEDGPQFVRMQGSEIRRLQSEPDLEAAEKLPFDRSDRPPRLRLMEPLRPMEPMEPMKPMEPMGPMRSMELRMGNMRMSMGGPEPRTETEVTQRFCTQCGAPVSKGDRFCGQCGHPLGKRD
ncbi:MAG: zinc-ribbon domain-containing protein [Verrucomicrobia bacterium]|nr:zinc-ribbon domain-containing protein [Verrucomicrobiota bacterium]